MLFACKSQKMIPRSCVDCGQRVQWVVLGINLSMFVLKGVFAYISNSRSLLTDSLQSFANVIITIVVLISLRMASKQANDKYPYGFGKAEFLASGIVNTLLMLAAIVFIFVSFAEMLVVEPEAPPKLIAIIAAVISIIANDMAFRYGRCAGEALGSAVILANAKVSRADVGTSVAVIIAVIGGNLGFSRLDHLIAIVICVLIIKVTLDGAKKAVEGLMDVSVHSDERHIRHLVEDIEGVERVGDIKARLVGRTLWVDMDVYIPPDWILQRGLKTVSEIEDVLHRKMHNISQISVQLLPLGSDAGAGNAPGTEPEQAIDALGQV